MMKGNCEWAQFQLRYFSEMFYHLIAISENKQLVYNDSMLI